MKINESNQPVSVPSEQTLEDNNKENSRPDDRDEDDEAAQIIPWRAQLRKTNSKLSLLD